MTRTQYRTQTNLDRTPGEHVSKQERTKRKPSGGGSRLEKANTLLKAIRTQPNTGRTQRNSELVQRERKEKTALLCELCEALKRETNSERTERNPTFYLTYLKHKKEYRTTDKARLERPRSVGKAESWQRATNHYV